MLPHQLPIGGYDEGLVHQHVSHVLCFIAIQRRLMQEDCCGGCGCPSDRDPCYVRAAAHLTPHLNIVTLGAIRQAVSMAFRLAADGFHIRPLGCDISLSK